MKNFSLTCAGTALVFVAMFAAPPLASAQSEAVIYALDKHSGDHSQSPLIQMGNAFYGTAFQGGTGTGCGGKAGCGTVFRIDAAGALKVLHNFSGGADGAFPMSGLVAMGGVLYGTTGRDTNGVGNVFSITPQGSFAVVHNFTGGSDGEEPAYNLTAVDGTLYGVSQGGTNNNGTIFSLTPAGVLTVLHSFDPSNKDGVEPSSPLLRVGNTLYGLTLQGGAHGSGTVFSLTLSGKYRVRYSFSGGGDQCCDGGVPSGSLAEIGGIIYGTTQLGGSSDNGTVFALAQDGSESILYDFPTDANNMRLDGAYPQAGLIEVGGTLFGTAAGGGQFNQGTVFELTQQGALTTLYSFSGGADGGRPGDAYLLYSGGKFYGTTSSGGMGKCYKGECGVIFTVTP